LNSGFKTKSEEIEWRRYKIIELKSQGLDQREIAHALHVSPTTITFDLQYLRKEARETTQEKILEIQDSAPMKKWLALGFGKNCM